MQNKLMRRPTPIVTLTTDFGCGDYYVGAMKGAILRIAPEAQLVDISHQIPPQDVLAAAFVLRHAAREFPPGTVHLAVVDPGVGTQRRPLALQSSGHLWVGPDNGLFSFVLDRADSRVHEIIRRDLGRLEPEQHLPRSRSVRSAGRSPLSRLRPRSGRPTGGRSGALGRVRTL